METKILIIEDDEQLSATFQRFLKGAGYFVDIVPEYADGRERLLTGDYGAVFLDINLRGKQSGIDLLAEIRETDSETPVVIMTGFPEVATATRAVRSGAFDYLCKPIEKEQLLRVARTAVRHKSLTDEKERYRRNLEAVFRSVRDAIVTVDLKMNITDLNEAANGLCLFNRDILGRKMNMLAGDCCQECLKAIDATLHSGSVTDRQSFACHIGGARKVVSLRVSPLVGHHGLCEGAVMVIRDETHLDSLERDLKKRRHFHNTLIGKSEQLQEIYDRIELLADVPTTVLVGGESGTGKELVAEALHFAGKRREMPLIKVNCSALSEHLLESELFGHVRGAFTGAVKDKKGRFELAAGGTLFLDEIGDISPAIQQKLLRVIQEKEFERVGDATPVKVDVRIITATNKSLKSLMENGTFREDLYYRLKVVSIVMPPLRDRKEDLPLLTDFFLAEFNREFGKNIHGVSSEVTRLFMAYSWPGNVREFRHALEHASILCKNPVITADDLPPELRERHSPAATVSCDVTAKAATILRTLQDTRWNKAEAARILEMSRQTLYRKLKELGIDD
jgi:PAS domain S-box-containing protein